MHVHPPQRRDDTTPEEGAEPAARRIVLKFGGTSVASRDSWEAIEGILRGHLGARLLVVHSALPGVTDALEATARGEERLAWLEERHRAFAREFVGAVPVELERDLEALRRLAAEGKPSDSFHPRLQAQFLAMGERMATRVSHAFLRERGLAVTWLDARELLTARSWAESEASGATQGPNDSRRWLSAECDPALDPELRARLDGLEGIGLTQGFTAAAPDGDTVVLGRGGTDAAAAYLAGGWGADRLEIWSDVPGMFSADPRRIPAARLLRRLGYAEAQEIATTGSTVLHPRSIPALRERGIPIHLGSLRFPEGPGTVIRRHASQGVSHLKAVSWKRGVVLVSMETLGMWQEVGFLARAFEVFRQVGLSVDLVSTSETNVTLSLDAAANLLDADRLERLTTELGRLSKVQVIQPCAAVSLVGTRIRGVLHRLAPALRVFEEHRIHLVSQAASDLNFTVVVDEDQGERLARQLHRTLISEPAPPDVFGPSWGELMLEEGTRRPTPWWERSRALLLDRFSSVDAAYVYHLDTVRERIRELQTLPGVDRVLYAMKANASPALLDVVRQEGAGFETVSRGEIEAVRQRFPDLPPGEILFTPNFAGRDEYAFALEEGVQVTLDALHPVLHWPEIFRERDLFVRVDPGEGSGHHEKVTTAGLRSKFGVLPEDLDELARRVGDVGARVTGLHVHSGSGITADDHWPRMGHFLQELAERFPDARVLDLGGGLPVPQSPGEIPLDLERLGEHLGSLRAARPDLELWLEPGRFIVAEAGVLLARVTQTKGKGPIRYVGLATGMNSLIRPALYGSYHEIVNLTRLGESPAERVQVVGPICETGDRLGVDRLLPRTVEGDLILIAGTGAYGRAMASSYNLRPPAPEFVVDAGGEVRPAG